MKGLTDTSALSGGLEIKTSGSEPWKVCSPSPWCARGILQDERQEWLPLVVSHNSHTGYTWQTPWHIRGSKAVKRAAEDKRWRARRWKKKKGPPLNMWQTDKWTSEGHNSVNPEEVMGAAGRSVAFPPWQITQNTHNERQEYGSGSLFLP